MFDTEKFIALVERKRPLYDVHAKEYSSQEIKSKCWREVGREMYKDWDVLNQAERNARCKDLQMKWKNLRDNFKRSVNQQRQRRNGESLPKKKKYVYHDIMQFLMPSLQNRSTTGSRSCAGKMPADLDCQLGAKDSSCARVECVETTPDIMISEETQLTARKCESPRQALQEDALQLGAQLLDVLTQSLERSVHQQEIDPTGNKDFLMSLLPLLQTLPADVVIGVRLEMLSTVQKAFREVQSRGYGGGVRHSHQLYQDCCPLQAHRGGPTEFERRRTCAEPLHFSGLSASFANCSPRGNGENAGHSDAEDNR